MSDVKSVCVYCGSSSAVSQSYKDAGEALGAELAANGVELVYGGGQVGIMGIVADAVLAGSGRVVGVIPEFLHDAEVGKDDVTELIRVESMHVRKQIMAERSDGFVVLPGGFGTLEEFFEILTWRQLKLHNKPIIVADIDGYWRPLVQAIDHIVDEGFARPENRALFEVVTEIEQVLPSLIRLSSADKSVESDLI